MDTIAISPAVHRQVIHDHLVACRPCRELLAYSRRAADREALVAWRQQLAVHLKPPPLPHRPAAPELTAQGTAFFGRHTIRR